MVDHTCDTPDWRRTWPDRVIYLPRHAGGPDEYADHVHVFETPGGGHDVHLDAGRV